MNSLSTQSYLQSVRCLELRGAIVGTADRRNAVQGIRVGDRGLWCGS